MKTRPLMLLIAAAALVHAAAAPDIRVEAVPGKGIQPKALTGADGTLHLVYYRGAERGGDLFHVRRPAGGTFSDPVRVNSRPESAIAVGTIRGAQIAAGERGRLHVVWNGSDAWKSADRHGPPMLYTRSSADGSGFEPERIISGSWGVDGGGSVAADGSGKVYVSFHSGKHGTGEAGRRIFVRRSIDGGARFDAPVPVSPEDTGVCGCCAMNSLADRRGNLYVLYRSALPQGNRDIVLLTSTDGGTSFASALLDPWKIKTCPMSSMCLLESADGIWMGWERGNQVHFGLVEKGGTRVLRRRSPLGSGAHRKHPVLAVNATGTVLAAWTENTGWKRAGTGAWQLLSAEGPNVPHGAMGKLPVWSFPAATAQGAGFVIYR